MQNRYTLCSILYDTHDNRRKKRENPFRETHQKNPFKLHTFNKTPANKHSYNSKALDS